MVAARDKSALSPSGLQGFRTLGRAFTSPSRYILKPFVRQHLIANCFRDSGHYSEDVLAVALGVLTNDLSMLPAFVEALAGIPMHHGSNSGSLIGLSEVSP